MLEATDPAAKLIELGQAKTIRAFDDDRIAVGDIQTTLDDRGADQHLMFAGHEIRHLALQIVGVHLAVPHTNGHARQHFAESRRHQIDGLHPVVQIEDLTATPNFMVDRISHDFFVVSFYDGLDGMPVGGCGLNDAQITGPRHGHVESAGNGGRAHGQHIDARAHGFETLFVFHAKTLFLVHNHQTELLEDHVFLQHPMGPDQDINLASRDRA